MFDGSPGDYWSCSRHFTIRGSKPGKSLCLRVSVVSFNHRVTESQSHRGNYQV
jgi:hypothetical protein